MNSDISVRDIVAKSIILLILSLVGVDSALAQSAQYRRPNRPAKVKKINEKSKSKGSQTDSDKLDISDLEKKYWAPKDTDFSVVQNRTFSKNKRVVASLLYGPVMNDLFNEGNNLDIGVHYFFNERMGVGINYTHSDLSDSDAIPKFKKLSNNGVLPNYGRMKSYYGASYNWVPFYAKMSVLGKKIIYFDMAFSPGIGITNYDQIMLSGTRGKSAFTFSFDVSQYFFFSKRFAVRLDVKNRWFKEDTAAYSTSSALGQTEGQTVESSTTNTTMFLLGFMYLF